MAPAAAGGGERGRKRGGGDRDQWPDGPRAAAGG